MASVFEVPCAATIGFDEAQAIVRTGSAPLGVEQVALHKAGRRILAREVAARIDSPRRDCAAMDGYAVRTQDLVRETNRLSLQGESHAGDSTPAPLYPGTAIRVSTGAPMPQGADRVILRELAHVEGDEVIVPRAGRKSHIRPRASDFACGAPLLQPGTLIDARAMVILGAADVDTVPVWRRPRVHVLTNGDELAAPGSAAQDSHTIPDSLSEALSLMARQWGAKPMGTWQSPDRADYLRAVTRQVLADADLIVVAGGASHGPRDLVREAMAPLGLELAFAGIAIKPGKPLWYGTIGKTHVLGLPGNPTAALTTARLFLAPLVCQLAGAGFNHALRWHPRRLIEPVGPVGDRDEFLCASTEDAQTGSPTGVRVLARQEASAQMMLAHANLLVERRAGSPATGEGTMVRCLRF